MFSLSPWIFATENCNLRCPYCFEGHVNKNMSKEVWSATSEHFIQLLAHKQNSHNLHKHNQPDNLLHNRSPNHSHNYNLLHSYCLPLPLYFCLHLHSAGCSMVSGLSVCYRINTSRIPTRNRLHARSGTSRYSYPVRLHGLPVRRISPLIFRPRHWKCCGCSLPWLHTWSDPVPLIHSRSSV